MIEIPGDSLSAPGKLRLEQTISSDGASGWSITLDGAKLVGNATIRLAIPKLDAGEPIPVVSYAESPDGPRTLAPNVALDGNQLIVTTGHFSVWFLDRWNSVRDSMTTWLKERVDALANSGNGSPPSCTGEKAIRDEGYGVTSDNSKRVYWCFGKDGNTPVLKSVNARGFTVAIEYTPGLTIRQNDRKDLLDYAAQLLRPPPSRPGNRVELLEAGSQADLTLDSVSRATEGVMITPNAGAYLLTALDYAVGTYTMAFERTGAGTAVDTFLSTLHAQQCLNSLSEVATTDITGPAEAVRFFGKALSMAFDCAETALNDADLGPILAAVVKPILWAIDGVRTVFDGVVGALDSLDTSGYQILVTRPVTATEISNVTITATDNPPAGWTARNPDRTVIDCTYPSPSRSSVGTDIVECGSTADGAHTCWIHPDRHSLTCAIDVWSKQFLQYRVAKALPAIAAADKPEPGWIELDDGTHCSLRHGGAWDARSDGLVGAYGCTGASYVVLTKQGGPVIDTSTPQWTVQVGELGRPDQVFPPPTRKSVTRAYFAASPTR